MLGQFVFLWIISLALRSHALNWTNIGREVAGQIEQLKILNEVMQDMADKLNKNKRYVISIINGTNGVNLSECLMGFNPTSDPQFWILLNNETECLANHQNALKEELHEYTVNLTDIKIKADNCSHELTPVTILCENQKPLSRKEINKKIRKFRGEISDRRNKLNDNQHRCHIENSTFNFIELLKCLKKKVTDKYKNFYEKLISQTNSEDLE